MKKTLTILICSVLLAIGSVQWSLGQTFGNALSLDGIDDYGIVPHHESLNPGDGNWSVVFWIKAADKDQVAPVVMKRLPEDPYTQYSYGFGEDDPHDPQPGKRIRVNHIESAGVSERSGHTTAEFIDGEWHHIVIVADKLQDGIIIYVDNNPVEFVPMYYFGSWPNVESSHDLIIGSGSSGSRIEGHLDELCLWNKALEQSDVQQLMNDTISPEVYTTPESGLVAYYRFDVWEDLGVGMGGINDIRDMSSYGNHMGTEGLPGLAPSGILTGLSEITHHLEFEIFPNPATSAVKIKSQVASHKSQVFRICNVTGKEVISKQVYEEEIDVSELAPGMYFIWLEAGDRVGVRKLIVE